MDCTAKTGVGSRRVTMRCAMMTSVSLVILVAASQSAHADPVSSFRMFEHFGQQFKNVTDGAVNRINGAKDSVNAGIGRAAGWVGSTVAKIGNVLGKTPISVDTDVDGSVTRVVTAGEATKEAGQLAGDAANAAGNKAADGADKAWDVANLTFSDPNHPGAKLAPVPLYTSENWEIRRTVIGPVAIPINKNPIAKAVENNKGAVIGIVEDGAKSVLVPVLTRELGPTGASAAASAYVKGISTWAQCAGSGSAACRKDIGVAAAGAAADAAVEAGVSGATDAITGRIPKEIAGSAAVGTFVKNVAKPAVNTALTVGTDAARGKDPTKDIPKDAVDATIKVVLGAAAKGVGEGVGGRIPKAIAGSEKVGAAVKSAAASAVSTAVAAGTDVVRGKDPTKDLPKAGIDGAVSVIQSIAPNTKPITDPIKDFLVAVSAPNADAAKATPAGAPKTPDAPAANNGCTWCGPSVRPGDVVVVQDTGGIPRIQVNGKPYSPFKTPTAPPDLASLYPGGSKPAPAQGTKGSPQGKNGSPNGSTQANNVPTRGSDDPSAGRNGGTPGGIVAGVAGTAEPAPIGSGATAPPAENTTTAGTSEPASQPAPGGSSFVVEQTGPTQTVPATNTVRDDGTFSVNGEKQDTKSEDINVDITGRGTSTGNGELPGAIAASPDGPGSRSLWTPDGDIFGVAGAHGPGENRGDGSNGAPPAGNGNGTIVATMIGDEAAGYIATLGDPGNGENSTGEPNTAQNNPTDGNTGGSNTGDPGGSCQ
jgi:hypothetical protein